MLDFIAAKFNEGGPFMWVILIVLATACAVILERSIFYFIICRTNGIKLVANVAQALNNDKIDEAIKIVHRKNNPLNVLFQTAVERYSAGMNIDDIQEGVDETAIKEIPKMSQRLNYLSLFANIATLLGLLGTISGLQVSFSSLAAVEAAQKAAMLARGISQAMNTTAFGLIVAVPCMILYTILSNKQKALTKELDEAVVRLLNYMKKKCLQKSN
ncbi:MAG: MotA/TolQ/ExbB proton channel family protein [Chitinispirillia bacterium]|jgi:biopolymer transport protein ExbB/TolQ